MRAAIERELAGRSRRGLADRAGKISAAYRSGEGSAGVVMEDQDALAYALARLPATYAACAAVFAETARIAPDFTPRRLTDAGTGPGGAAWAALEAWPDLVAVHQLEAAPAFIELARRLAADAPEPLRAAAISRTDLTGAGPVPAGDLVIASYVLAEIAAAHQGLLVDRLWAACEGVLALVEPGTPAGFERLRAARARLITQGAVILAPCPHEAACPIGSPDWCHFAQRLPRSRDHRLAKGGDAPFEDEKFAYVVAARPSVSLSARTPRILAPPRAAKPGIALKLCTSQGIENAFVARRDKAAHAAVRRLGWGDATP